MFETSPVVGKMLDDLSTQLKVNVTLETAQLIYDMCSYETAWNKTKSAWCFLKSSNYKIFEFIKDLKTYWTDGYGNSLNYKQACPVLVDMFEFFTDKRQKYKISAYFSHTSNILKTLALLNIIEDKSPLRYDTFEKSKNRNWRTSLINTFATNLAFILYDCDTGPGIVVHHQERIFNLQGCPKNIPCPLDTMKNNYPLVAEHCNFKQMCALKNSFDL